MSDTIILIYFLSTVSFETYYKIISSFRNELLPNIIIMFTFQMLKMQLRLSKTYNLWIRTD